MWMHGTAHPALQLRYAPVSAFSPIPHFHASPVMRCVIRPQWGSRCGVLKNFLSNGSVTGGDVRCDHPGTVALSLVVQSAAELVSVTRVDSSYFGSDTYLRSAVSAKNKDFKTANILKFSRFKAPTCR